MLLGIKQKRSPGKSGTNESKSKERRIRIWLKYLNRSETRFSVKTLTKPQIRFAHEISNILLIIY